MAMNEGLLQAFAEKEELLAKRQKLQASLFSQVEDVARNSNALMSVLDGINAKYGRDTSSIAAAGTHQSWVARAENKTPCYTTRWSELPKAWAQ